MREWIKTDDMQWRRDIDQTTFDFVEVRECSNGYNVVSGTIDLSDYDENDVLSISQKYGYKDFQDVQNQYGNEADGIIAECIFEQSFEVSVIKNSFETEDAAEQYVELYIKSMEENNYDRS